jgi:hypothetical protein
MQTIEDETSLSFSMKSIAGKGYAGEAQSRLLIVKWINVSKPTKITLDGKNIPLAKDEQSFYQSPMPIAWFKKTNDPQLPNEMHVRMIGGKSQSGTIIMHKGKTSKK